MRVAVSGVAAAAARGEIATPPAISPAEPAPAARVTYANTEAAKQPATSPATSLVNVSSPIRCCALT
jgi:hypothetical protein